MDIQPVTKKKKNVAMPMEVGSIGEPEAPVLNPRKKMCVMNRISYPEALMWEWRGYKVCRQAEPD